MMRAWLSGMSYTEVGEMFGVDRRTASEGVRQIRIKVVPEHRRYLPRRPKMTPGEFDNVLDRKRSDLVKYVGWEEALIIDGMEA